jgi:hypothetical protein
VAAGPLAADAHLQLPTIVSMTRHGHSARMPPRTDFCMQDRSQPSINQTKESDHGHQESKEENSQVMASD